MRLRSLSWVLHPEAVLLSDMTTAIVANCPVWCTSVVQNTNKHSN